jgi:hypothetical protein
MLHTHLENFKSEHAIVAVSLEAHPTKPAGNNSDYSKLHYAIRINSQKRSLV